MNANPVLWGVETAAQQLAEEMVRALPVTIASVALWDQPSFSLTVRAVSTPRPLDAPLPLGARVPLSSARWHRVVFERHEPMFLEEESPTQVTFSEEMGLSLVPGLKAIYLLPIRFGEETVGVLGLGEMRSREREPFTEEKRTKCRAVLEEFLAASAHAWEAGRLRRQIRSMSSLLRMVKEIFEARQFEDVLACCASEVSDWLGTPVRGVLFRARPDTGMEIVGRWRLPDPLTELEGAQLLSALARIGGNGSWPLTVTSVTDDPLDPLQATMPAGETWTRVSLPLLRGERLMGVACLYVEDEILPADWELEAFRRRAELVAAGMGILERVQEDRAEREWLCRAAWELVTTHQRTVLREAISGIATRVSSVLPGRLEKLAKDLVPPGGGEGPAEHRLAEGVVEEVTGVLADLHEIAGLQEDGQVVPLEVNQLMRRALEIARVKWEEGPLRRGVPVELDFQPSAEPLLAEVPIAAVGALAHAIKNAVEAIPDGGRIRVWTARDDGHVLVSISDTGPGVAEEHQQEAFTPFFSTKGGPHLGLGLSVVRAFAARHGGEAILRPGEAGGTILVLRLPAACVPDKAR